jgi:hypothetical protein
MYTIITIDTKQIVIDFSSAKEANNFIRGYNEWRTAYLSGDDFPCVEESTKRGASFAQTITRYARINGIRLTNDLIKLFDQSKNKLSLFDSF